MTTKKIAAITGGSGLLGDEIIRHVEAMGWVAINLDINHSTDLSSNKVFCDLTSVDSMTDAVNMIVNHYGRIDGLVNNGYPRTKDWGTDFETLSIDSWNQNMEWQLGSYVTMCQLVIPFMKKSGGGAIVNMASIYGIVGNDFSLYEDTNITPPSEYSAIKGGLINFTRFLASKYSANGICVNCVSPGGVFNNQDAQFVKRYVSKVPIKRMALPSDIASPVMFLLSDGAKYICGHNLVVDGGWTAI